MGGENGKEEEEGSDHYLDASCASGSLIYSLALSGGYPNFIDEELRPRMFK